MTAGSDSDGRPAVVPDPTATAPGRGAHLHPTRECYDLAVRRKAFPRALRRPGELSGGPVAEYLRSWQMKRRPPPAAEMTRNGSNSS